MHGRRAPALSVLVEGRPRPVHGRRAPALDVLVEGRTYVVVVETNVFGKTDSAGKVLLIVDDSARDYAINIWSPRIRDSKESLVQVVSAIPVDGVSFRLQKSLRPAHVDQSDAVAWDDY